jgi:hypothetical protein
VSVQRTGINIICDGPNEQTDCPDNASFMDAMTAAEIRWRLTREDGWLTGLPGGIDRCPKCLRRAAGVAAAELGPDHSPGAANVLPGITCTIPGHCDLTSGSNPSAVNRG